jgi:RNA polymerase sigma-70 factor (ECF subfamily)
MEDVGAVGHEDIRSLLEKARAGDREAFRLIVSSYQRKVFGLAYSILRNREDAMDVVQETFMRLYQKLGTYESDKNFHGWLLQIAKNLSIDHYRKHISKHRETESDKSLDELNLAAEDRSSDPASSDLRRVFARSLERLGERQRMIFVMRHYNGLGYAEIAEVLRISVGTVKSLHFKAVQNLRRWLSPELGIQP